MEERGVSPKDGRAGTVGLVIVQNVASDLQGSGDPMTVYVTGDVHGGLDMQKLRDWELGDSLTGDDYLIVAGDFGFP